MVYYSLSSPFCLSDFPPSSCPADANVARNSPDFLLNPGDLDIWGVEPVVPNPCVDACGTLGDLGYARRRKEGEPVAEGALGGGVGLALPLRELSPLVDSSAPAAAAAAAVAVGRISDFLRDPLLLMNLCSERMVVGHILG